MLAERVDAFSIKQDHLRISQTDTIWTNTMSIFQYMIGNSDYAVTGRHNVKLLKLKDAQKIYPIPVPYDFDYSGIVDALYAIPGETLGLKSVKERYFLGPCRDAGSYQETIKSFQNRKVEIYELVSSFEYLSEKQRKTVINYLDEFFKGVQNPGYVENFILSTCQK